MSRTGRVVAVLLGVAVLLLQMTPGAAPPYSPWSEPVSLGDVVNSPYDDAVSALSRDGLALYFTSNRPAAEGGVGGYDIWVSRRASTGDPWGPPVCLDFPVNTELNDAGPVLSRDGHWLFFHRSQTTAMAGFDLVASWREHTDDDFGWQAPYNLGPNVNTDQYNEAGPTYFEGDEGSPPELYFGSDRLGGYDIFVSRLGSDGVFGPAELVAEVSSAASEQRPGISYDGREMYFTSNRAGSVGATDIWVSTRPSVHEPWTVPVNVAELNTSSVDAQAALSGKADMLVFTTSRPGVIGMTDLFVATRTKERGGR